MMNDHQTNVFNKYVYLIVSKNLIDEHNIIYFLGTYKKFNMINILFG